MRKIGVIGGTFDPVHYGHLMLAEQSMDENNLDEVMFMPVNIQPFKQDQDVTCNSDRLEMLKLAISGNQRFSINTVEIDKQGISYTVDSLNEIREKIGNDCDLYFILGTDMFLNMEKWYRSEELLKKNKFIVGERPGYRNDEIKTQKDKLKKKYGTTVIDAMNILINVSSTEIRERIHNNQSISYLVPDEVKQYIQEKGLYID